MFSENLANLKLSRIRRKRSRSDTWVLLSYLTTKVCEIHRKQISSFGTVHVFLLPQKQFHMSFFANIEKLKKIDRLIRLRATGTPNELAAKINVSRATLFRIIVHYKEEFNAPVYFDKSINSYRYEYPGKLIITFEEEKEKSEK